MTKQCKACGQDKSLVLKYVGFKLRHMHEDGTLWVGRLCYDCFKKKQRGRPKKERLSLTCSMCNKTFFSTKPTKTTCSDKCYAKQRLDRLKHR